MNTITKVSTKINATEKVGTKTELTIVWDNVSTEDLHELARKSVVIMWQAVKREEGIVPAIDTVNVADLVSRERRTRKPVNLLKSVATMTPEQKAALLAMLQE